MDFSALASRMAAGLEGVRACLIVSGDGLSLGVHPEGAEGRAKEVWDRLAAVGDPQRGFFNVGDELWVVARRGWYAALLIASPSVRPGIALDRLESYLKIAEEARVREAAELGPPTEPQAPARPPVREAERAPGPKPRSQPVTDVPPPVAAPSGPPAAESFAFGPRAAAAAPSVAPAPPPPPPPPPPAAVSPEPEPMTPVSTPREEPISARVAEAPAPPQPEPTAPSVSPQPEQAPAAPEARVDAPAQVEAAAVAPPVEAPPPAPPVIEPQVIEPQREEPPAPASGTEGVPSAVTSGSTLDTEPVPPVIEPEPKLEVEEPSAPASGTEGDPSAVTSGSTPEPEPEEPSAPAPGTEEVLSAVASAVAAEPEPEVDEADPDPEGESRRLVLDMTTAETPDPVAPGEPADDGVKESASEADDGSETRRPAEVDRVALTREFAQLFADMEGADES